MRKLTLGCDPEIFLVDAAEALVSSIDRVGGSKYNPRPLEELGDGYAVQEDNVAVEFNIPPADTADDFVAKIKKTVDHLREMVDLQGLHFSRLSAAHFPVEQLQDPRALEFGCEPDFNAWTGRKNPRPKAADKTLRSCGGHVHIGGLKEVSEKHVRRVIQFADLTMGVPSVIVDKGDLRKQLYGKHGAFRLKSFGGEYRTLSNFWIFDDDLVRWIWNNTALAVEMAEDSDFDVGPWHARVTEAIDNNNLVIANEIVKELNIPMPQ